MGSLYEISNFQELTLLKNMQKSCKNYFHVIRYKHRDIKKQKYYGQLYDKSDNLGKMENAFKFPNYPNLYKE